MNNLGCRVCDGEGICPVAVAAAEALVGGGGEVAFVVADGACGVWVEPAGCVSSPGPGPAGGVQAVVSSQVRPERVSPHRIRVRRLSAAARVCSQALFLVTPR